MSFCTKANIHILCLMSHFSAYLGVYPRKPAKQIKKAAPEFPKQPGMLLKILDLIAGQSVFDQLVPEGCLSLFD